jgi:CheY-like chemotaxis protein
VTAGEVDGSVTIRVEDSGPGVPRDVAANVFEPFFTTKPAGVGTGLGLSICHGIVSAIGGRIDIASEPGRGTRVSVRVPCLMPETGDDTRESTTMGVMIHPTSTVKAATKGRVLVVDDEPLIRRVVEHALHVHEVVLATNGREALEQCEAQSFDVILCDIMMPEVNGVEFYHRLRELQPGAEDDIIFFSGGTQIDEIHEFLDAVPNECLEKPVQRRRLQQRVEEYVRGKRG